MTWTENSQHTLRGFMENMVAEGLLAKAVGMDVIPSQVVGASFSEILRIAEETLPLARVMDESDLVLHAEGPGAAHHLPWLSALNWITTTAETNLRRLSSLILCCWRPASNTVMVSPSVTPTTRPERVSASTTAGTSQSAKIQ